MSTLAEQMQADALEAQRFSRKHLVLELDFSAASIGELEANADTVEYAIAGGKSDENIEMLSRIWGAYIGEAFRQQSSGQWVCEDDGRLALQTSGGSAYPQEQVRQRLTEGADFNLATYFATTLAQLQ